MSHFQELTAIADDISDLSPESAVRLRALAMRVRQQERYCDDAVEQKQARRSGQRTRSRLGAPEAARR